MKIRKVKFKRSGVDGIVIEYSKSDKRGNMVFSDQDVSDKTAPVHKELSHAIRKLRYFGLHVAGIWRKEWDQGYDKVNHVCRDMDKYPGWYSDLSTTLVKTQPTFVSMDEEGKIGFGITKVLFKGSKALPLNMNNIKESDEYEYYQELKDVIDEVYKEVEMYMNKGAIATPKQYLMDFYEGSDDVNMQDLLALPEEQQAAEMKRILEERHGMIVFDAMESSPAASEPAQGKTRQMKVA